ncbi:MAG: hypothetical protein ACUVRU_03860 [Anaerolineae bacterium]
MTTPTSPKANSNTLTECRQAVDTRIFQKRRDALFETLDAFADSTIAPGWHLHLPAGWLFLRDKRASHLTFDILRAETQTFATLSPGLENDKPPSA